MDHISFIRDRLNQRGFGKTVTEAQLLEVLRTLPPRLSYGVPLQYDDSRNHYGELVTLTPAQRQRLGVVAPQRLPARPDEFRIPRPDQPPTGRTNLLVGANTLGSDLLGSLVGSVPARGLVPQPSKRQNAPHDAARSGQFAQAIVDVVSDAIKEIPLLLKPPLLRVRLKPPLLRVRVHALVCRNDDGRLTGGDPGQSLQAWGEALAKVIAAANKIFASTGIELVFYPSADVEIRNDTRLNQDFIVPSADKPRLTQEPLFSEEEINDPKSGLMATKWLTHKYREGVLKQYAGKMVWLFADGTTLFKGVPATQSDWHYCKKCQGLFINTGKCPAGGAHDSSASGNYMLSLMHDETAASTQDNWRYCSKCEGLTFAGNNAGVCPAGGQHNTSSSGNYVLSFEHGDPDPNLQKNWRWCKKCQGLFFGGAPTSKCPGKGTHDGSASGNYTLAFKHDQKQQWVVSSSPGGAYSSHDMGYVRISGGVDTSDGGAAAAAYLCHETGHYLHLWHTFTQIELSKAESDNTTLTNADRVSILENRVLALLEEEWTKLKANGLPASQIVNVLDGDAHVVSDTPPDDSGQLLYWMNLKANGTDACGPIGTVNLKLKDGTPVSYTPDRSLVMSYFFGCLNFPKRFSPKQAELMRNVLMNKNRRHLVGVQLGDEPDVTAFRSVARGVGEQVGQHLDEPSRVGL